MAPINHSNLARRGIGNGNIFSIVFATVALVLLAICFVWACLWPWVRMKYINDRFPVQVRSTDGDHLTRRRRESRLARMIFDSPRNSRVSSKQDPTELRTYDPRSETPFPNQPRSGEAVSLPYLTPRTQSATDLGPATTTHSFLTPTKGKHSAHCSPLDASVTATASNTRQAPNNSASSDKKLGDAKDYILAIPEPIALTPRFVGETPTPSKNLPGLPVSRSVSSDKHLHPNKLFKTLTTESRYINRYNDSQPVTQDAGSHDCNPVTNCSRYRDVEDHDSLYETEEEGTEQDTASKKVSDIPSVADMSQISTEEDSDNHNPSLAAIHRLRTYRSLTGAVDPRGLTRSATVTRAKTPVAEMRDLFDRTASEGRRPGQALPRDDTFVTETAVPNSSEKGRSSSTHATSMDFSASSLSLLPTPLRIRAGSFGDGVPPVPMTYSVQGMPVDTSAVKEPTARDVLTTFKKTMICKPNPASTLSTRLRPVPAPLELSKLRQPKTRFPQLREVSSASSIVAPLVTHNKGSPSTFRGSSVYSRDTKGASIARTPLTPNFGSTGRIPVSPYFPGSDKTGLTNRKPSSPADMIQNKVDNWHYHVGANLSHRDLNGPGPELRTSQRFSHDDVSVISTEYNPAEEACGRMSIPRVQVNKDEVIPPMPDHRAVSTSQIIRQVTSDSALVVAARGHAPGGAGWV